MAAIPSRKATFTEEEKRMLVEGTNAQGKPLSESEKMKLSKMHTARTLGSDWREQAAARSKAGESARAQQALDERAAINRRMQGSQLPSPLQRDASKTEVDLPGGGKVKFGIDTLARMRGFEEDQAAQNQASEQERRKKAIAYSEERKGALRKRYEDELASRGFAPPKTRQEAEEIDRARREEFDTITAARNAARMKEKQAVDESRAYKQLARMARKNGDFVGAAAYNQEVIKREAAAGGDIRNATTRRSVFEDREMQAARERINQVRAARKAKMQMQNTSTPEASSFTSTSSAAPMNVGGSLSYNLPYENVKGSTEQPFGLRTPSRAQDYLPSYLESPTGTTVQSTIEDGVDFSSISPYNTAGTRTAGTTAPASQPATPKSTAAFPTSTQQTIEDVLPGASNMPVVQRNPNETPAQHNARVLQEYENNVILPSLSEDVRSAFLSAKELNEQERTLYSQRFISPKIKKRHEEVAKQVKEQHDILKSEIDKLRKNSKNWAEYPMGSPQRKLNDQKIATLRKQLGFFAKRLY